MRRFIALARPARVLLAALCSAALLVPAAAATTRPSSYLEMVVAGRPVARIARLTFDGHKTQGTSVGFKLTILPTQVSYLRTWYRRARTLARSFQLLLYTNGKLMRTYIVEAALVKSFSSVRNYAGTVTRFVVDVHAGSIVLETPPG